MMSVSRLRARLAAKMVKAAARIDPELSVMLRVTQDTSGQVYSYSHHSLMLSCRAGFPPGQVFDPVTGRPVGTPVIRRSSDIPPADFFQMRERPS